MKYRYLGLWLMCFTLPVAAADRQDPVCADPCLKAAIAALYIRSPFLSPFKVDIQVKDSVATLRGSVSDAGERALAEEIAGGLDGITAVINRIRVNPSISAERVTALPADCLTDDDALVDRVKAQLHWHRATHGMAVKVSALGGVVTLRGKATDAQQLELARLITLNTCGVKQVDNQVQLSPPR